MPEEESNLSFAEFGVGVNEKRVAIGAPKRPYTAPASGADFLESDNPLIPVARREGFDGSLRSAKSNPWGLEGRFGSEGSGSPRVSLVARREGFEPPTLRFEA